jgi:hypothetical protein
MSKVITWTDKKKTLRSLVHTSLGGQNEKKKSPFHEVAEHMQAKTGETSINDLSDYKRDYTESSRKPDGESYRKQ